MIYVDQDEEVFVTKTVYNKETGKPCRQITTLNELLHAPPDGSPSLIEFDEEGRPTHMWWHVEDVESRLDGPSAIIFWPESGIHMTEAYRINGEPRPASQGPYRIRRNKDGSLWKTETENQVNEAYLPAQRLDL